MKTRLLQTAPLLILASIALPSVSRAAITLGADGGLGFYDNGIGADPSFGIEALDDLYAPFLVGFYAGYSPLGGATQGAVSVNASLISFGVKAEYPLPKLLSGLSVGLQLGGGYETVPVNAGGTLASGSAFVFGVAPDAAYDYRLSPAWSAGIEADLRYVTAPSFSGAPGSSLVAPVFLVRIRYSFGQSAAATPPSPAPAPTPAQAPAKAKKAKKAKPKKPTQDDDQN
jgi:hypothetical protein